MTIGNTLYHTKLPGSSRINMFFPQQTSKVKTTRAVLRLKLEVPGQWGAKENEESKELHHWSENGWTA